VSREADPQPHGKRIRGRTLLWWACLLALVALVLMVWSLFDPGPVPVMVAMSLGQLLGTASLAIYVYVVVHDLRRARVLTDEEAAWAASALHTAQAAQTEHDEARAAAEEKAPK